VLVDYTASIALVETKSKSPPEWSVAVAAGLLRMSFSCLHELHENLLESKGFSAPETVSLNVRLIEPDTKF
jgi:hypothetical protein